MGTCILLPGKPEQKLIEKITKLNTKGENKVNNNNNNNSSTSTSTNTSTSTSTSTSKILMIIIKKKLKLFHFDNYALSTTLLVSKIYFKLPSRINLLSLTE